MGHIKLLLFLAYVKTIVPFGARVRGKTRDTWLLIGSVIAAILLLLLLVALFVLILSKSQSRKNSAKTSAEIEEERGNSNLGYDDGDDGDDKNDVLNVNFIFKQSLLCCVYTI